jgi:hypothetical protein
MGDEHEPVRTGPETEPRTVISPDAVALTVRQAEARREAMIAKWDQNGWLAERTVPRTGSPDALDHDQQDEPTAA